MFGTQNAQHRDLIAGVKFGAAQAVFPRFQGKYSTLHNMKAGLLEEFHNVGEGKYGIQFVDLRFGQQRFHQTPSRTMGLLPYRQRPDFRHRGAVEMQRAAAQKLAGALHHREIPDGFRHFKFGARQHDALGRIAVDQRQDGRDVAHHRLARRKLPSGGGAFEKCIGPHAADHAALPSVSTIRVPIASPASTRLRTFAAAPGAIRTCSTPPRNAATAAFNLASMPPVATPSAIKRSLSAAVRTGRPCRDWSSTPSTSVRKINWRAPNAAAHATAIWSAFTL